jgi:hypothetical protein
MGVVMASLTTFLAVLAFLAFQMSSGHDPSLGAKPVVAAAPAPRRVVVRRIVQQRVIVTKVDPGEGEGDDGGTAVVNTSAPSSVSSAPAPTPAAVTPPPTTRSS